MTLLELKKLAQSANSNVSKEPCVECGFNHLSYRHKNSCSEPETVFKKTFNPPTALRMIELLEMAEEIVRYAGNNGLEHHAKKWLKDLEEL